MREILFFSAKKKIKNQNSKACADGVGEEIDPVASAAFYKIFLYQLGEAAVGDADDESKDNCFLSIG